MALWGMVHVNRQSIGTWSVQRIEPVLPPPDDDTICLYRYVVEFDGEGRSRTGALTHRFGDGALTLMRKVFDDADS